VGGEWGFSPHDPSCEWRHRARPFARQASPPACDGAYPRRGKEGKGVTVRRRLGGAGGRAGVRGAPGCTPTRTARAATTAATQWHPSAAASLWRRIRWYPRMPRGPTPTEPLGNGRPRLQTSSNRVIQTPQKTEACAEMLRVCILTGKWTRIAKLACWGERCSNNIIG
jgi:hypothetical protein